MRPAVEAPKRIASLASIRVGGYSRLLFIDRRLASNAPYLERVAINRFPCSLVASKVPIAWKSTGDIKEAAEPDFCPSATPKKKVTQQPSGDIRNDDGL